MAMMQRKHGAEEDGGNIFWVTMSDLMLGLAIIFITLFVLAMTGFNQKSVQQQRIKMEVAKKIEGELQKQQEETSGRERFEVPFLRMDS